MSFEDISYLLLSLVPLGFLIGSLVTIIGIFVDGVIKIIKSI